MVKFNTDKINPGGRRITAFLPQMSQQRLWQVKSLAPGQERAGVRADVSQSS